MTLILFSVINLTNVFQVRTETGHLTKESAKLSHPGEGIDLSYEMCLLTDHLN